MSIWFETPSIDDANARARSTLNDTLGLEITKITESSLHGRMPVDDRTRQPAGMLHGGASVAFAEMLASWAATFAVDRSRFHCVGMEINANHVRPVAEGWVYGEATPASIGKRTHVWDIRITNDAGKLVCVSRCTIAVIEAPSAYGLGDSAQ